MINKNLFKEVNESWTHGPLRKEERNKKKEKKTMLMNEAKTK